MGIKDSLIKNLPNSPGIYIFKNSSGEIIYIGKAKNLKKRVSSYFNNFYFVGKNLPWRNTPASGRCCYSYKSLPRDKTPANGRCFIRSKENYHEPAGLKESSIVQESAHLEHIVTKSECEAMILEAKLILGHKPKFNVLLKEGQPFLYFFITGGKIPELKLVRNKRQKGEYFGPFFEKGPARRVYDFLIKTFRLKICKKKIPTGCLYYHMGICSGSCRPDFNLEDYKKRLDLAKLILSGEKSKCLEFIDSLISKHNKNCEFEKSRELYLCKESLEKVSESLDVSSKAHDVRARHDIWVLMTEAHTLFVFKELNGALKKQHEFYIFSLNSQELSCLDYLELYYRTHVPSGSIITNFYISREKINLYQAFFEKYYKILYKVRILVNPESGHDSALLELANVQAQVELDKRLTLGKALGRFLKIKKGILSIDCFDVSHKQGRGLVGACVRFVNGVIEKNKIRYFHIKTLKHQDDYKSLQEIISRRYKDKSEIPDLVVIDGGKGQLSAAREILPSENIIALAKREEIIYSYNFPEGKKLDEKSYAGALLINIRDYAHHSAISFHRKIYKI